MRIKYVSKTFRATSLWMIDTANEIIAEYQAQGYDLTLRQLYYQMVARDLIPNKFSEYKRVGSIINDARLAGKIDWDAIVDRTRVVQSNSHWTTPKGILETAASNYLKDRWEGQEFRPEVWIEKDALIGVIAGVCQEYDTPYFSCRGYSSQSAMHEAGRYRLKMNYDRTGQKSVIIHLADHDPSGIDMSRDIDERLTMFAGWGAHDLKRIALNMDQVNEYNPPPNPTKLTDSRAKGYILAFGYDSWELDALEPKVINDLIEDVLLNLIDIDLWDEIGEQIDEHKKTLSAIAKKYDEVQAMVMKK